jgi:hypothetical protein
VPQRPTLPVGHLRCSIDHPGPLAADPHTPDTTELLVEALSLQRRAADLKRRHERVIESVGSFPNVVNERRERELAAGRVELEARISELEQQLQHHGLAL